MLFFDFTMLAKELRYSDALHGGKAGSLVCSLLVEMDWSATDSKVPEAASVFAKKENFNTIYIYIYIFYADLHLSSVYCIMCLTTQKKV